MKVFSVISPHLIARRTSTATTATIATSATATPSAMAGHLARRHGCHGISWVSRCWTPAAAGCVSRPIWATCSGQRAPSPLPLVPSASVMSMMQAARSAAGLMPSGAMSASPIVASLACVLLLLSPFSIREAGIREWMSAVVTYLSNSKWRQNHDNTPSGCCVDDVGDWQY